MKRAVKALVFPFAFLLFASGAGAGDLVLSPNEAKLIGAWQESMKPRPAATSAGQPQGAKMDGLLGAVVQYKADHTFVMYPPCNAKKADLRKAGLQSISGTWELMDADKLIAKVEVQGRSLAIETRLSWKDDQLVLMNKDGTVANRSGRYQGSLPPSC